MRTPCTLRTIIGAALLAAPAIALAPPAHADSAGTFIECLTGNSTQEFSNPITYTPQQTEINETGTVGNCVSDVPNLSYGTYVYSGNGVLSCLGGNSTGKFTWRWHDNDGNVIGSTVVGLDENDPAVVTRVNGNNVAATTADTTGGSIIHPGRMVYTEQLIATDQTACLLGGLNTQTGTNLGLTFIRNLT
ncbi:hypothetical protein ACWD3K_25460 [Streptomyces sp. NPDC002778]